MAELPFIGEIVQVVPDESKWVGAIERMMRSVALSIIVPKKLISKAEAFLEENHLGDRVTLIAPTQGSKIAKAPT